MPSERTAEIGIEEGIDHREAVREEVGQRAGDGLPYVAPGDGAVGTAPAVFDDAALDVAVLHHQRVVEHRHVRHAARGVTAVEIAAEQAVLVAGRLRRAEPADQVPVCRHTRRI